MGRLAIAIVLLGCQRPMPEMPPMPPPVAAQPVRAAPRCELITEFAPLETFYGALPVDATEDAIYNAALQFLVTSAITIESQDPVARTITTKRIGGQTWVSTCAINHYFVYALRIAVVGRRMIVSMPCWKSLGWEAGPGLSRNRGELAPCEVPTFVSKGDALIPSNIFGGAVDLFRLSKTPVPAR